MCHLAKNRYIANGTITKDKESSISQNVKYEIEKQQRSIEKELKDRLNKVNMELYDINNTIQNINDNDINLFIDGDKLMETINESKLLIEKLNKLSKETIRKLQNICNYSTKDNLEIARNNVKNHMYVLTRAQSKNEKKILKNNINSEKNDNLNEMTIDYDCNGEYYESVATQSDNVCCRLGCYTQMLP